MAIVFLPAVQRAGFDGDAAPNWQMVPKGGSRVIQIVGAPGQSVVSSAPATFTVAEILPSLMGIVRTFSLTGVRDGTAQLHVKSGASINARLDVDVKAKRSLKVTFNFVRDSAGHKTARGHGSVDAMVRRANAILIPQSNVEIRKHRVRNVRVNQNLRRVVRFSSHLAGVRARQHEWDDVIARADATADRNVFFVWEYEQDNTPLTDNTNGAALGTNILFEDGIRTIGNHHGPHVTLAHEVGHTLGLDHTAAAVTKYLISGGGNRTDVYVSKAHATTMNP